MERKTLNDYITRPDLMSDCCHAPVYTPNEAEKSGGLTGVKWVGVDAKCLQCYEFCKAISRELPQDLEVEEKGLPVDNKY